MKKLAVIILIIVLLLPTGTTAQETPGPVTLTEASVTWQTVKYTIDETGAIAVASVDTGRIVEQSFTAYFLENEFLRVGAGKLGAFLPDKFIEAYPRSIGDKTVLIRHSRFSGVFIMKIRQ